jgi:hypothetical protein
MFDKKILNCQKHVNIMSVISISVVNKLKIKMMIYKINLLSTSSINKINCLSNLTSIFEQM